MSKQYDVALSFAGEDRPYVEKVAEILKGRGIKLFYDEYEKHDLWGKNLYDHLSSVYKDQCQYVIMFVSKYYANKVWTNLERESAQAAAFRERKEYILPVRFDDTEIPGVFDTIGYLKAPEISPADLVRLFERKLGTRVQYWLRQAEEAANFANRVLFEAHRGAFLWRGKAVAVFANVGPSDRSEVYAQKMIEGLDQKRILSSALSDDGYTWVVMYDDGDPNYLTDLIWKRFLEENPDKGVYVSIEHKTARAALRNYLYITAME
ncbi:MULTISPECIES: toll/interleukin-1 receptor domain-containing protein [unclassified Rhizobium]|uniref:toll/interleukin-1 receptor domain-containing protein n=1 Tax=unclassified Rhizobium TaxID=2613769 RepID=UPI00247941CF|nr:MULTISPECIES: TIR domain-containing protein [unclassified Rhizobium]MDH7802829.1 hypothetical protein [Rhizobium sp. AN70]